MADTIVAISTPAGEGGIGIVRTSGELSLQIMKNMMRGCPEDPEDRHAYFGMALDFSTGEPIDEAIFIYMCGPHTYTREDVLEIQAHGSVASLRTILRSAIACGARLAEPGEFTKLAFLNGRIDLAQAEAVIDLITAKTDLPRSIATAQLEGRLSTEVSELRAMLVDTLAEMAVNIDFPDEDIEEFTYDSFNDALLTVKERLEKLLKTADAGRIVREGLKIAIIGKPNVGKSSLMNAMLGESRVIVTDIPGTTRDTVEESVSIAGIPVVLVDTAGMRESEDAVESIGIARSKAELELADMVLFVLDGSRDLDGEDRIISELLIGSDKPVVTIINKSDVAQCLDEAEVRALAKKSEIIHTSLIKAGGADIVKERIEQILQSGDFRSDGGNIITNERHRACLVRTLQSTESALDLIKRGEALEIAEVEVHDAYDSLGEIIGEAAGEEILDAVFMRFCLGK